MKKETRIYVIVRYFMGDDDCIDGAFYNRGDAEKEVIRLREQAERIRSLRPKSLWDIADEHDDEYVEINYCKPCRDDDTNDCERCPHDIASDEYTDKYLKDVCLDINGFEIFETILK